MKKISVILNCYKRFDSLPIQIEAIKKQTIQPHEIFLWVNASDNFNKFDKKIFNQYVTVISNFNFGVWSRFSHAFNTTGEYICVFDDDTIPGKKWFENCLNEMNKKEALYGTRGVIFNDYNYNIAEDVGWHSANTHTTQVDIVGHSWFFPRKYIECFWKESIIPESRFCGEDIHFSYSIQKYLDAPTLVPPHPREDIEMWGSKPELGWRFGADNNAISREPDHLDKFAKALNEYKRKGFKLLKNK